MTARKHIIRLLILAALVIAALAVAGCGSSGSSSSSSSESTTASGPPGSSGSSESSGSAEKSTNTGKPFKGEPKIVKFGKPASASDAEAASKVLAENLEARESGDFATQCASLTPEAQGEVVGSQTPKTAQECPKKLEELATPLKGTEEIRTNTFDGSIDELRMEGQNAYALYHGNDGNNYAMPMLVEGGAWKVGSIVTIEIE